MPARGLVPARCSLRLRAPGPLAPGSAGPVALYNLPMITLLLFTTLFQTPAQAELPAIPKFLQVNPQFCTGGQPRLEHFAEAQGRRREVRAQPAAAVRASRGGRAGGGRGGRDEVLQHPGRLCESDRCRGGRVPEDHRRSGEPADVHPLHGGDSRRRVLDDPARACATGSRRTQRSKKAERSGWSTRRTSKSSCASTSRRIHQRSSDGAAGGWSDARRSRARSLARRLPRAWRRRRRAPAGALVEEPCTGIPVTEARCLHLTVAENQTTRRGRTISLRIVVLPATGTDRARTRSSSSPAGPDRRRRSSSATRLWPQTGCAYGATSCSPTSAAPAARTRSRVSSTVRPMSRRPTSTRFSRSRKCGPAERGSSRPPTWRNTPRARRSRISKRSGSR